MWRWFALGLTEGPLQAAHVSRKVPLPDVLLGVAQLFKLPEPHTEPLQRVGGCGGCEKRRDQQHESPGESPHTHPYHWKPNNAFHNAPLPNHIPNFTQKIHQTFFSPPLGCFITKIWDHKKKSPGWGGIARQAMAYNGAGVLRSAP